MEVHVRSECFDAGRMNLHSRGPGVAPGTVFHPRGVGNEDERRETAGERGRNHSAIYLVSLNKREREVSANRSLTRHVKSRTRCQLW